MTTNENHNVTAIIKMISQETDTPEIPAPILARTLNRKSISNSYIYQWFYNFWLYHFSSCKLLVRVGKRQEAITGLTSTAHR